MVQAGQLEGDNQLGLPSDVTLETILPAPQPCCAQSPLSSVGSDPGPWRSLNRGLATQREAG